MVVTGTATPGFQWDNGREGQFVTPQTATPELVTLQTVPHQNWSRYRRCHTKTGHTTEGTTPELVMLQTVPHQNCHATDGATP